MSGNLSRHNVTEWLRSPRRGYRAAGNAWTGTLWVTMYRNGSRRRYVVAGSTIRLSNKSWRHFVARALLRCRRELRAKDLPCSPN